MKKYFYLLLLGASLCLTATAVSPSHRNEDGVSYHPPTKVDLCKVATINTVELYCFDLNTKEPVLVQEYCVVGEKPQTVLLVKNYLPAVSTTLDEQLKPPSRQWIEAFNSYNKRIRSLHQSRHFTVSNNLIEHVNRC